MPAKNGTRMDNPEEVRVHDFKDPERKGKRFPMGSTT